MIFLGYDFQKIFDTIASNFNIKTYKLDYFILHKTNDRSQIMYF